MVQDMRHPYTPSTTVLGDNEVRERIGTASKQEACGFVVIILRDFSNEGDIGMANYEK